MPKGAEPLSIEGWLMRGAIREDDAYGEKNPQDDLYPSNAKLRRPLHHFFDPLNNRPLTVTGLSRLDSDVHKAPDWAMGSADVFTQPDTPEVGRRNHFTVFDARESMFRALTLMGRQADGSIAPLSIGTDAATREQVRKTYWATTFRALDSPVLALTKNTPRARRQKDHAVLYSCEPGGHRSHQELSARVGLLHPDFRILG